MAIDTAAKRLSMMNTTLPWRGVMVKPSGTVDAAERAAFMYLYNGIAFGAAAVITDNRTASGRIIMAFDSGDKFRLRAIRTDGSDDLQTIDEGSAMTCMVFRN